MPEPKLRAERQPRPDCRRRRAHRDWRTGGPVSDRERPPALLVDRSGVPIDGRHQTWRAATVGHVALPLGPARGWDELLHRYGPVTGAPVQPRLMPYPRAVIRLLLFGSALAIAACGSSNPVSVAASGRSQPLAYVHCPVSTGRCNSDCLLTVPVAGDECHLSDLVCPPCCLSYAAVVAEARPEGRAGAAIAACAPIGRGVLRPRARRLWSTSVNMRCHRCAR